MSDSDNKHRNRLANENSPYLLSHSGNPVDWYPWGEEALNKAKTEDKPIFLSIGYAACHWCHVMERESFEDETIAKFLNEHFVSIKVDREQRPDLDQIYMNFTTAMTGQGGWPMSVFLTPDLRPFFAGTYFPPDDRYGRPGFMKVISEIARAYAEEKEMVVTSSHDIFQQVAEQLETGAPPGIFTRDMLNRSAEALMKTFDETHGGFGLAPKFPHSLELSFLLRYYKSSGDFTCLRAAEKSLRSMARGGIYDQLGGGFARYSTDREWLVPHFEKMLYDNALLIPTYVEAYQITKDDSYHEVVRGTLDFILREMTHESGGFYSALDADSEGEEGKFYVWTASEIHRVLGEDAAIFGNYYNVTAKGNFEGKNILHLTEESERVRASAGIDDFDGFIRTNAKKLLDARNERIRPLTDDKILTSWNGLAVTALCKGYQITGDRRYLEAAVRNAEFVRDKLFVDGKLVHSFREGMSSDGEFLEDYAFYVRGLLDLFESDDSRNNFQWLQIAVELSDRALELFIDDEGRFYLRPDGQEDLILRPKDETDGAIPAPGSFMINNLLKLNRMTSESRYLQSAEKGLRAVSGLVGKYPGGMTSALFAIDYYFSDKIEIVIVGDGKVRDRMLAELYQRYLPNRIIAPGKGSGEQSPLFEGRNSGDAGVAAYVCINSVCRLPVSTLEGLNEQLGGI